MADDERTLMAMQPDAALPDDYTSVLVAVKDRVHAAKYEALRAVNRELVSLYWDIGRLIVERQQGETWGQSVVRQLAKDLQTEFPGVSGFSTANMWRMKLFYEAYSRHEKVAQLVRLIGWSHNVTIVERCKDPLEREYYVRMTRREGWSRATLMQHIDANAYHRFLTSQNNFAQTLPEVPQAQALLGLRDEYIFGFLDLAEEYSERQLEQAIVSNIGAFLRAMGGLFTFVGSQFRLEVSDREFFIDLLLFHRRLKCLVAVELKVGEFQPEYAGKMQFYLSALDDLVREEGEGPSIGIILCREKDRTIVEYALRDMNKPIGVAEYRMLRTLPEELRGQLPSPEQVAMLLTDV